MKKIAELKEIIAGGEFDEKLATDLSRQGYDPIQQGKICKSS